MFSTGCEDLDLRIGGFSDGINLIYGTPATGKTTLGMITSNFFASKNKKVFYIDSENGFTVDRFKLIPSEKPPILKSRSSQPVLNMDLLKNLCLNNFVV